MRARWLLMLLVCASAARDHGETLDEDESDSAPFMIVVEEQGGSGPAWRCAGSLVSLRTAVTSAGCARGRAGGRRPLLALSAATAVGLASRTDGARQVSRVATAGSQLQVADDADGESLLDLAVLELEAPFSSGANARPILMATAPDECSESGGVCHVVRALDGARLRIVDAALGGGAPCAERVRQWALVRDRALCLTGPRLCRPDWGAGVVCGGKLCGVVSRSGGRGAGAGEAGPCGDTHAAQAVARWRRFLHCAHTLRACGRGSCAELCSERRLVDEDVGEIESDSERAPAASSPTPAGPASTRPHVHPVDLHLAPSSRHDQLANSSHVIPPTPTLLWQNTYSVGGSPTRTTWPDAPPEAPPDAPPEPTARGRTLAIEPVKETTLSVSETERTTSKLAVKRPVPPARSPAPRRLTSPPAPISPPRSPAPVTSPTTVTLPPLSVSVRPTPLFEPNRPDFRAGEYGDNAAEYGEPADEAPPTNSSTAPTTAPPGDRAPPPRTAPAGNHTTPHSTRPAPPVAHKVAARIKKTRLKSRAEALHSFPSLTIVSSLFMYCLQMNIK